ncbi:MAG TPA: CapA family protein [Pilimelia sp.]|nr:CapA family protein [Pilimelia sp.]
MAVTLALAGDTMLGRGVADRIAADGPLRLFAPEVRRWCAAADLRIVNLECCVSDRGAPWPAPGKPFFFRAPPAAVQALVWLGVDCVTLGNNHALDFGRAALRDTLRHLADAGIACVGAGVDARAAAAPVALGSGGAQVTVLGATDHPADFAAGPGRPGVAYVDLRPDQPGRRLRASGAGTATPALGRPEPSGAGTPAEPGPAAGHPGAASPDRLDALTARVRAARRPGGITLVTPHWGPNMTTAPQPAVRRAAAALVDAGATLVAGHSAHVFHGVAGRVLFDLGDFIDDYAVDPRLRNDLGLLWLVTVDAAGPRRIRAVPLALDFCHTRLADRAEYAWVRDRLTAACAALGTGVADAGDHLEVATTPGPATAGPAAAGSAGPGPAVPEPAGPPSTTVRRARASGTPAVETGGRDGGGGTRPPRSR